MLKRNPKQQYTVSFGAIMRIYVLIYLLFLYNSYLHNIIKPHKCYKLKSLELDERINLILELTQENSMEFLL